MKNYHYFCQLYHTYQGILIARSFHFSFHKLLLIHQKTHSQTSHISITFTHPSSPKGHPTTPPITSSSPSPPKINPNKKKKKKNVPVPHTRHVFHNPRCEKTKLLTHSPTSMTRTGLVNPATRKRPLTSAA